MAFLFNSLVKETYFDDGRFPTRKEVMTNLAAIKKVDDARPAPFEGATKSYAAYSVIDYGARIQTWFTELAQEEEQPTTEQWGILRTVRDRILTEILLGERRHAPTESASRTAEGRGTIAFANVV